MGSGGTPVHGRDADIARLARAVGDGSDGMRFVHVVGAWGVGTTTLVRAMLETRDDVRVTWVSPTGIPGSSALAAAVPGLAPVIAEPEPDTTAVLQSLAAALAAPAPLRQSVLVLDEVQSLDDATLAVAAHVVALDQSTPLTVVVIEQQDTPEHPPGVHQLFAAFERVVLQRLAVNPLDDAVIAQLVQDAAGGAASDVPAIVTAAAGNPWFALELVRNAAPAATDRLPASVGALTRLRLHGLDEAATDLATAAALCFPDPLDDHLARACCDDPRAAGAAAAALVCHTTSGWRMHHPLLAAAVAAEASPARRRALHLELASTLEREPDATAARRRAHHLAGAGRTPAAVDSWVLAAALAEVDGHTWDAAADLRRALDACTDQHRRRELLCRAAAAAGHAGQRDEARELWLELHRTAHAAGDLERAARALHDLYWIADDGTDRQRLQQASLLVPPGDDQPAGWASRAAAALAILEERFEDAARLDRQAVYAARQLRDRDLEAIALEKLAYSLDYLGQVEAAAGALDKAIGIALERGLRRWAIHAALNLAEVQAGALRTADALAAVDRAATIAARAGITSMAGTISAIGAINLARAGRLTDAADAAAHALAATAAADPTTFSRLLALAADAVVAVELGAPDAVRRAGRFRQAADAVGDPSLAHEARFALARACALAGDVEEARRLLRDASPPEPQALAALAAWWIRLWCETGEQEDRDRATGLAAGLPASVPVAALVADEISDLTGPATDGGMRTVADRWIRAGRPLDAARCRLARWRLDHRDAFDDPAAVEALRAARRDLVALNSMGDVCACDRLLAGVGVQARGATRRGRSGILTSREEQLAGLVAAGRTNREIASQLGIAEDSVVRALTRAYRKVGVQSRAGLAAWWTGS